MPKAIAVLLTLFGLTLFAQEQRLARNAFMNEYIQEGFDYWIISNPNTNFHSSFKPYLSSTFQNAKDSLVPFKIYSFHNNYLSKTFSKNFDKSKGLNFQLQPILDLGTGYDLLKSKTINTAIAGIHLKTNLQKRFTLAFSLFGGQSQFPFFNDTVIAKQKLIPEYGQAYLNNSNGYSFFDYTGYISYNLDKKNIFNIQAGRGKHFIGDGYRSVLLSDFGPAYPYLRINTNIWRIQYSVWYTMMNDVSNAREIKQNFQKKYGTFHYLSYNILKEVNVGFFENIVWRGTDTNQVRSFEVNYLNPIIFFRPQEYSVGSSDNSFVGFNTSAILFKRLKLYGQIGLDEFYLKEIRARNGWWANKIAWQFGAIYINAFGIKGLKLQVEYNEARPYTYTHGLVDQNYAHYGQPLSHPLGANFKELLGFINYRKNKWELSAQLMYVNIGKDSSASNSNVGQNIFLSYTTRTSDYGNYTGQGIKTEILQSQLRFTYFIIQELNMRLELCYVQRSEKNALSYKLENPFVSLGFKTSFWNSYRDF